MNKILVFIITAFVVISLILLGLNRYVWDAVLLLSLALICLVILLFRGPDTSAPTRLTLKAWIPKNSAAWLRGASLLVSLLVTVSAMQLPLDRSFILPFILWMVAIVAFILSLVVPWLQQQSRDFLVGKRLEIIALSLFMLVATLIRGAGLGKIPANLGGDEGTQLTLGLRLVTAPFGNPFATGWFSVPTLSFAAYGLAMKLWGATIAGGRALSVIAGSLTVLFTYLLGTSMGGRRFGWVAAILMAFSSYHIHFSRLASNQIFDPFIGTLAFFLIDRALKERYPEGRQAQTAWGVAGVVAGLGWYAYFGARWVSFLIGLVMLYRWLTHRAFVRNHFRGLVMLAMGWLVVVLPLLGWYVQHPSALTERYNAVSIFASGWLSREVVITGKTASQLMLQQVWRSVSAFHLRPDPTFWYYPQRPLLDTITGVLMLVGLVACFWQLRWPSKALTLLWFWSTLVMAWVLTENPPSSQRGLLLMPAVAFLGAWGFESLWSLRNRWQPLRTLLIVALLCVLPLNLVFYFGLYTPRRSYGNPTAEIATRVSHYTLAHPQPVCADAQGTQCTGMIYFLGPPRLYWEFGTMAFLLRAFPGQDVAEGALPTVTTPARFILIEGRIDEIGTLMQTYPGGEPMPIMGGGGTMLALIYDWVP